MQQEHFVSVGGVYTVDVTGASRLDREDVWMRSVGAHLHSLSHPLETIFNEYKAACVGERLSSGVSRQLKRARDTKSGKVSCVTTFQPNAPAPKRACAGVNSKRDHCRAFRAAIEAHYEEIEIFIGVLANSHRDFRIANCVMSMESTSERQAMGHSRRRRIRYCSGVAFPRFKDTRNWTKRLIDWGYKRNPMGSLVRNPQFLLDGLRGVVMDTLLGSSIRVGLHTSIDIDFLFWLDGTSSGLRAVSVVKFRLIDCARSLFEDGKSPVKCWMEAFCDESKVPFEYRRLLLRELNMLWGEPLWIGSTRVNMRYLLLMADNKQLGCLCGVQGGSTSQRCSCCTLSANNFCIDAFGGEMRSFQKTALDAVACATDILGGHDVPECRRRYDNVADIPFVMLDECTIPLSAVLTVPPAMHNNRNILENVFEWIQDNISYPLGTPRTKMAARTVLQDRLRSHPHLHTKVSKWNNTSYRIAFSDWQSLFGGLLHTADLPIPFMASVISFLLNSPLAHPTSKRCATLVAYTFILPRLMDWTTSNLYWHTTLHFLPVIEKLGAPLCTISEENFESEFRPIKRILRNRSNNQVGGDLLAIRAFGEAKAVIRAEWTSPESTSHRVWAASVSMDVVLAPCLMRDSLIIVNLPGLIGTLSTLDPEVVCSVVIAGTTCLRICCGDVPDCMVLCKCQQHVDSTVGRASPGFPMDEDAVRSARHEIAGIADPDTVDELPARDVGHSSDSERESEFNDGSPDHSDGGSSSSAWEPRSYFDDGQPTESDVDSNDEPISSRLRPRFLGHFYSERKKQLSEVDEPEYELP